MVQEITKAQLLALRLTRMMEAGAVRPAQISLAKRNNVWMALECARRARDIMGAVGITDRYSVIRHLMNLESVYTYEGTHDIHTLVVGQDITGLTPSAVEAGAKRGCDQGGNCAAVATQTPMTRQWIAERSRMGSASYVSNLLQSVDSKL